MVRAETSRGPKDVYSLNDLAIAIHDESNITKCRKILASGVDVNAATSTGTTPLMFAVMPNEFGDHLTPSAMLSMAKFLLGVGADATPRNKYGMTACDYARQLNDPNWKDRFGYPAAGHWNEPDADQIIQQIIALLEVNRDK